MNAKQLKNAILQAAVQGKLVPQDPSDEHADKLIASIRKEKAALIKAKKLKPDKSDSHIFRKGNSFFESINGATPTCLDDSLPFDLPPSWTWARLGSVGSWGAGATPSKTNPLYYKSGTIPWLVTGDLNDSIITNIPKTITELAVKETSVKLNPKGAILIAMYGATIGKLGILGIEATTNQACCACQPFSGLNPLFLFYYLMSAKEQFKRCSEGGAQPNISKEKIQSAFIPLPPLAEQGRIVAKIEELMPYIKEFDTKETALTALHKNFPIQLKKSILQAAVQGKLVPQDPSDEHADKLIASIRKEKANLIKAKKLKPDKAESHIIRKGNSFFESINSATPICIDDSLPFDLPPSWTWARLGSVFTLQAGKFVEASQIYDSPAKGLYPCYGGNGLRGYVSKYNNEGTYPLIGRQGALCGNINVATDKFHATEHAVVVDHHNSLNPIWAARFLHALNLNQYATATAQPGLSVSKVATAFIPVPPLAEQERIVSKIEELLAQITTLPTAN